MTETGPQQRRRSVSVDVGGVIVGGDAPVVVQSMTNTDTADVEATARQVSALANAGSEIVRITVDRNDAAAAVPRIKERLNKMGVGVPIVGDFHYIGHKLLADHPACAEALDKYRINPGNVGFKEKKDKQFGAIVETAIRHDKPVRIGANWGSLDQELTRSRSARARDLIWARAASASRNDAVKGLRRTRRRGATGNCRRLRGLFPRVLLRRAGLARVFEANTVPPRRTDRGRAGRDSTGIGG